MTLDEYVILDESTRRRWFQEQVTYTCSSCHGMFSLYLSEIKYLKFTTSPNDYTELVLFQCPCEPCKNVICWRYDLSHDAFTESYQIISKNLLFPNDDVNMKIWPSYVPEKIVSDYNQAVRLISISPEASIIMGRRALERIILAKWPDVALEGKSNSELPPLNKMVEYVQKQGSDYMDGDVLSCIKNIGNNATHIFSIDSDVEFSESDATLVVKILELMIVDLFVKPEERNELKISISQLASKTKIDKLAKQKKTIKDAKEACSNK